LVVDVNSLSNGLQVISGFISEEKTAEKKNGKGSYRKGNLPPVPPGSPILP